MHYVNIKIIPTECFLFWKMIKSFTDFMELEDLGSFTIAIYWNQLRDSRVQTLLQRSNFVLLSYQTSSPNSLIPFRFSINPLTPNDQYRGRTAPLTSKRYILYIYSTNLGTEYFKHGTYSPFFLFKMQFVSKF